jgi:hypothetical protein
MVREQDGDVMVEYLMVQAEARGDWMVEVLPHGMVCGVGFCCGSTLETTADGRLRVLT